MDTHMTCAKHDGLMHNRYAALMTSRMQNWKECLHTGQGIALRKLMHLHTPHVAKQRMPATCCILLKTLPLVVLDLLLDLSSELGVVGKLLLNSHLAPVSAVVELGQLFLELLDACLRCSRQGVGVLDRAGELRLHSRGEGVLHRRDVKLAVRGLELVDHAWRLDGRLPLGPVDGGSGGRGRVHLLHKLVYTA